MKIIKNNNNDDNNNLHRSAWAGYGCCSVLLCSLMQNRTQYVDCRLYSFQYVLQLICMSSSTLKFSQNVPQIVCELPLKAYPDIAYLKRLRIEYNVVFTRSSSQVI
ncbi:hypothetical protein GQX74_012336, partial [Glossina fuscipes]